MRFTSSIISPEDLNSLPLIPIRDICFARIGKVPLVVLHYGIRYKPLIAKYEKAINSSMS